MFKPKNFDLFRLRLLEVTGLEEVSDLAFAMGVNEFDLKQQFETKEILLTLPVEFAERNEYSLDWILFARGRGSYLNEPQAEYGLPVPREQDRIVQVNALQSEISALESHNKILAETLGESRGQ